MSDQGNVVAEAAGYAANGDFACSNATELARYQVAPSEGRYMDIVSMKQSWSRASGLTMHYLALHEIVCVAALAAMLGVGSRLRVVAMCWFMA